MMATRCVLSSSSSSSSPKRGSSILVACNIYVSAGRHRHAKILTSLLDQAQEQCRLLRQQPSSPEPTPSGLSSNRNGNNNTNQKIAIIHAFADAPYDRSSFHIAGAANLVADVASRLATSALKALHVDTTVNNDTDSDHNTGSGDSVHPNVGLVDHISVMPLLLPFPLPPPASSKPSSDDDDDNHGVTTTEANGSGDSEQTQHEAAGHAAQQIGHLMSQQGCVIHYYGSASDDNASLASIRRDRTRFFKSGGCVSNNSSSSSTPAEHNIHRYGTCCIGAPRNFVENFNVRLVSDSAPGVKRAALSLCKTVRERSGGLAGVEALSLPYNDTHDITNTNSSSESNVFKYEVAGNLLLPHIGSRDAVQTLAHQWMKQYRQDHHLGEEEEGATHLEFDNMYGVGTTQRQCLRVLELSNKVEDIQEYDEGVMRTFESFLV